ncbi:sugar phosphate nucleotidyltransferase [Carboxylicivirga caseinilyticus]|uniref:sugar phosphate nucleotidyltransferase n=1 Tax=Carboxylicivirga caseinilyticus TaxID=3417572 RepID=UPI003D32DACE|nr:NTP transferase domain-containing protein [Marinilabiliaceae bacterium A049]
MNAMIFAAGLGTRLQPLTNNTPKALVDFRGKPLLWHAISNVIDAGAERIIVNVHHFGQQVIDYLNSNQWEAEIIISDESELLLDTGGGLVKAKSLFIPEKPVLIQNADILLSTNIKKFIHSHNKAGNSASLMVKKRETSRYLLFDEGFNLSGWENTVSGEVIKVNDVKVKHKLGFCGVHLIEPDLIKAMGEERPFSIVKAYLSLADKYKIGGYQISEGDKWFDVGTVNKLHEANLKF